ncbi:LLM class flavin-dependent oxidoreductase [Streptomyces roseolilacinus]|uniref:LLM class flavin-dependent oxidoreductase n=1 Tax=Streptomyces roseolilacinus TaxID=66904 RepID=UPI00381074B0
MRFGLLYQLQLPRPWDGDSEERLIREALEQIELADRLGFDHAWATEHHFLEEYSHSSAPEVFLAAAAARTERIRLSHGIVTLSPAVNHPARVAERIATLDLISGGRVDFGTGQGSSQMELDGFGVDRATKRDQWREAVGVVTRMLAEEPFTGHKGRWIDTPPRNVVPKPKQKPHPPLWVGCTARPTIEAAARAGLGALALSFSTPEEAKEWVDLYYQVITSDDCVPAGLAVNPNFAVVLPLMCHHDADTAFDRGIDGAHFWSYCLMYYYFLGRHRPGGSDMWREFQENRARHGLSRDPVQEPPAPGTPQARLEEIASLRQGIGTPDQLADLVRRYEAAGVDQIIFAAQLGRNRHDHVCESLRLFAEEVMPEFTARREARDAEKNARLEGPVRRALARIPSRTTDIGDYAVGPEMAG